MEVTQQEQNVNYSSQAYFENLFEVWKNLLDVPETGVAVENLPIFSKELIVGNLTGPQEKELSQIFDFIGDLKEMGLYNAIPPFLMKAQSVLMLSRSRAGMQQEMFTTQTMRHNYEDKNPKKRGLKFWRE